METCDENKKKSKRKFSEAWLSDGRYKAWIRQVSSDDTLFYCNICKKNFSHSSHVFRHADSAYHKNNTKENLVYTDNINVKTKQSQKQDKRTFRPQWLDIQDFKL